MTACRSPPHLLRCPATGEGPTGLRVGVNLSQPAPLALCHADPHFKRSSLWPLLSQVGRTWGWMIDGESQLPCPTLAALPLITCERLASPPFAGGPALESSRMLLVHHAQPRHPERWTRLGWKWEERRDDLLSYQIALPLRHPLLPRGFLPGCTWIVQRDRSTPFPASDSSSFSPLLCPVSPLPCPLSSF